MTEAHMSDDDSGEGRGLPVPAARGGSNVPVAITKAMTMAMVTFQGETKRRGGLRVEGARRGRDYSG